MKTWNAKPNELEKRWYLVDADGQNLGRLATRIADTLRGKRKPEFTPHVDTGDFVVVINAEKIAVTGKKLQQKRYYRHSGYPGGLRSRTLAEQLDRRPTEVLRKAVKGMLPRNPRRPRHPAAGRRDDLDQRQDARGVFPAAGSENDRDDAAAGGWCGGNVRHP